LYNSYYFDLLPFHLKIDTPVTRAQGNIFANFDFSTFFCFWVTSSYGTDWRARRVMRPIWRQYNNSRNVDKSSNSSSGSSGPCSSCLLLRPR